MIMTSDGLDLDFKKTKESLGMVPDKKKYRYSEDPDIEGLGREFQKLDYRQYLTRFKWNNLPEGLDSELFERIMYYSGSAMFFYIKDLDRFYFLPYGMTEEGANVGIDFYGRFNKLRPYSFNGATDGRGEKTANGKRLSKADIYLSTQVRENIKDIPMVETEEEAKKVFENGAVICFDNSPQLSYYVESRNRSCKELINYMLDVLIQTRSALINSSGFNLFSTENESNTEIMQLQIDQINQDRRKGKLSAVVSKALGEIENLQSNTPASMQDFWASFQSVDNLRLKTMGISNDGVQQKSQYMNIQEQSMDINDAQQVYYNSFMERVKFAAIVNSIWGLDIFPEPLLMPQQEEQPQGNEEGGDDTQAQEGTNEN